MKRFILALMVGALISSPAIAQQSVCGNRDEIISRLESGYLEKKVANGLGKNGMLVEIFVSKDTRTFTIIQTTPAGVSCLMQAGDHWEDNWLEEDKGPAY